MSTKINHDSTPDPYDPVWCAAQRWDEELRQKELHRLSSLNGVGLTRYDPVAARLNDDGEFDHILGPNPEGEWVRYEDAAAAIAEIGALAALTIAAEKARLSIVISQRDILIKALEDIRDLSPDNARDIALDALRSIDDGT